MKPPRALLALIMAGALALAGCATRSGQPPATPGSSATGAADAPTGSYDFTATTLDGATFDGHSLAGKPALLWFWAPWCPTCLQQARPVTDLAAKYQGKITVVGVAGLDQVAAMHDFVKIAKLSGFPQLADEQGVVWKRFKMTEQSTFVVLDRTGKVIARGHTDVDKLPGVLDQMLAG